MVGVLLSSIRLRDREKKLENIPFNSFCEEKNEKQNKNLLIFSSALVCLQSATQDCPQNTDLTENCVD